MRMRWMGAASASSTPGFWAGLIAVAICAAQKGEGQEQRERRPPVPAPAPAPACRRPAGEPTCPRRCHRATTLRANSRPRPKLWLGLQARLGACTPPCRRIPALAGAGTAAAGCQSDAGKLHQRASPPGRPCSPQHWPPTFVPTQTLPWAKPVSEDKLQRGRGGPGARSWRGRCSGRKAAPHAGPFAGADPCPLPILLSSVRPARRQTAGSFTAACGTSGAPMGADGEAPGAPAAPHSGEHRLSTARQRLGHRRARRSSPALLRPLQSWRRP